LHKRGVDAVYGFTAVGAMDLDIPLTTRLHQGLGRQGFRTKFEKLLESFEIVPASFVALQSQWPDYSLYEEDILS